MQSALYVTGGIAVTLGIYNLNVFLTYGIVVNEKQNLTTCGVVPSRQEAFYFAVYLVPWLDVVLYSVLPSVLLCVSNCCILLALVSKHLKYLDQVDPGTDLQKHVTKTTPMLLLVSTYHVISSMTFAVYIMGKYSDHSPVAEVGGSSGAPYIKNQNPHRGKLQQTAAVHRFF